MKALMFAFLVLSLMVMTACGNTEENVVYTATPVTEEPSVPEGYTCVDISKCQVKLLGNGVTRIECPPQGEQ